MGGISHRERVEKEQKKQEKMANKQARKQAEKERNALFNDALLAVNKKKTTKLKGESSAVGRDASAAANEKKNTSRAMKMMFQMDAKEMEEKLREDPNYVPTLEDEVEAKRQELFERLKKTGKKGTPVTPETLKAWQEKKRKRKTEAAKKLVEAESRKRKGGKGLSVLSGRELYEYNSKLFKDKEEDEKRVLDEDKIPASDAVEVVAEKVQEELFLDGDDDLSDIDDD